ncbi:spore coat protein CotH, partial [Runella sp. CRIBMP]|nr:spore coat protein CotH [Runella sp. CRIBMP]
LSPPVFSHVGGFYSSSFGLTISHPDVGVSIYYTTDGSVPSAGSLTPQSYTYRNNYPGSNQTKQYQSYSYTGPLTVDDASSLPNKISTIASTHSQSLSYLPTSPLYKGKVVRAVAVKAGALTSEITSSSFFFSSSGVNKFTLPVVSVMSQEDGLFSYNNGIYVPGIDFDNWRNANPTQTPGPASPANYHRSGESAERPAHFEIIETDTVVYKQDVGLRINGSSSASYRVKSLRLYGTDQYKTIEHPLFPQLPYDEYKTFILRNSGQDYTSTLFRDALAHESVAHLNIDIQAYRPAILFLNGEYWGIHNMRQRQDKHYYAQKYGVNEDSLDLIDTEIEEGSATHYNAMLNYIYNNGVTSSTNYNYVKTQMDVENFRDYQIIEIFYNNQDWGTNNNRYWRRQVAYTPTAPYGLDGRWRWSLYDLDLSMSDASQDRLSAASEGASNSFAPGFLLARLLQNQTFRNDFINRFADLMNTTFLPNRISQLIEGKRDGISAEIPAHLTRWKTLTDSSTWLTRIASCIKFVQDRPGYQRTHIRNKFGLSGQYNLTVNVSNPAHGYVRVNTIDILPTTPGVNASPYPWTGSYFYKSDNSIPVVIRARPKLGYKFKHWVYNSTILTDSVQTITASAARSYTAVFEPALVAATLESCGYVFKEWASSSTAGTFPANMKFVYMADTDPGLNSDVKGFTTGG